jgi:hypothetical protein
MLKVPKIVAVRYSTKVPGLPREDLHVRLKQWGGRPKRSPKYTSATIALHSPKSFLSTFDPQCRGPLADEGRNQGVVVVGPLLVREYVPVDPFNTKVLSVRRANRINPRTIGHPTAGAASAPSSD